MRITKLKKYVTWNIISLIGYISIVITLMFWVMFGLSSSQLNIRPDLNEYVYDHMFRHVIFPYMSFYKVQLMSVLVLIFGTLAEQKYYEEKAIYGYRIFDEHDREYSIVFVIGLILNLCPLYLFSMFFLSSIAKILRIW